MTQQDLYVAGPYEGVSQAPPQVRLAGACEDMQDCIATIPNGIQKRPPFVLRQPSAVATQGTGYEFIMEVPRGSPSLDATVLLQNIAGVINPVIFRTASLNLIPFTITPAAQAYLNLNNPVPNRDLRGCSIEDVTFITNRTVRVGLATGANAARPPEALIWVKLGEYARQYSVTVTPNGGTPVTATYKPSTGGNAYDAYGIGTDVIAKALYDGITPTGAGGVVVGGQPLNSLASQGYSVSLVGTSLIYITHPTNDFTVSVSDDQGGTALEVIKTSVPAATSLPAIAVNGFIIEINPTGAENDNGAYFLQFEATTSTTSGIWKEVLAPGSPLGYDLTTLPIQIAVTTNYATGVETWVIQASPFLQRTTGNLLLSPDPDFVTEHIQDIKWNKGRLAFIHEGGVEFSGSDTPYRWYTSTLTTDKESDPFGFLTPVERKAAFKQGFTFDQRFVCLSDKTQGIVSTQGVFEPDNARMDTLATEDFNDAVPVQGTKHRVYITAINEDENAQSLALSVSELAIDRLSGLALIEEMSTAVPEYLPTTLDRAVTYQTGYFTLYGSSGQSAIYVHTFRYSEQQRVQNSFYRWNLPAGYRLSGWFIKNTTLYAFGVDSSGYIWPFTLSLSPRATTLIQFLDLRQNIAGTYDPYHDRTTFTSTLPVSPQWMVTDQTTGHVYQVLSATGTTIVVNGPVTGGCFIGIPYASYYIPTEWFINGQDGKPIMDGRLSVKALILDAARFSGYLRAEVSIKGRATRLTTFEATYQDDPTTPLDGPSTTDTVKLRVPIGGNARETSVKIVSDTHLGFKLVGYEWQGDLSPRHRRGT